jgi:hypothetical protein
VTGAFPKHAQKSTVTYRDLPASPEDESSSLLATVEITAMHTTQSGPIQTMALFNTRFSALVMIFFTGS